MDAGVAMEEFLLGDSSGISGVPLALELFEVTLFFDFFDVFFGWKIAFPMTGRWRFAGAELQ